MSVAEKTGPTRRFLLVQLSQKSKLSGRKRKKVGNLGGFGKEGTLRAWERSAREKKEHEFKKFRLGIGGG